MSNNLADRVAELEAQCARLASGLAALEQQTLEPAPRPATLVSEASVTCISPFEGTPMPTAAELADLYSIVIAAYPALHRKPDRFEAADAPIRRFENAFRAITVLGRTTIPNPRVSLSWWTGKCADILRSGNRPADVDGSSFAAAALAAGDVTFLSLDRWPYDIGFGLSEHLNTGRRTSGAAWRTVLATRKLLDPLPAPKYDDRWSPKPVIGEWTRSTEMQI